MTTEEMAYFHTRYDLLVRAVSRRICLPKDCCDDLYLDTFAKVFRRTRPVFTDASDEKNWLVSICVSGYREMLRYRKRRELLPVFLRNPPSIPYSAPDQSIRPLSELLQDEKEQMAFDGVNQLPEKYRLPVLLFYFLDKQASVVASVLHISQRAVLTRLHQGSAMLADQRLDETLHSSLRWHEAEKQTEEDAAFKKVAKLAHPAPAEMTNPAGETERRRKHRRWLLAVGIPLVLILIGALSFSRPGAKQTPEPGRAAFSDFLGSADAYVYPVTPEKTPEVWKTLGSHDAMIEACQIPESLLWSMSTEGLVETCLNYPMTGDMMAFNSPTGWLEGVGKNFNGLQKLLQRKDAGFELLRVYRRVDYSALCKSGL
ncbi:MAG TPA: sigma-70 family RNA polymerase sigma factor, partial [Clostridia bacterium]